MKATLVDEALGESLEFLLQVLGRRHEGGVHAAGGVGRGSERWGHDENVEPWRKLRDREQLDPRVIRMAPHRSLQSQVGPEPRAREHAVGICADDEQGLHDGRVDGP